MDLLPQKLLDTPSIFSLQVLTIDKTRSWDVVLHSLQELFCRSFEQLLSFDSTELDEDALRKFCSTLETMKKENKDVVWQMAKVAVSMSSLTFCPGRP